MTIGQGHSRSARFVLRSPLTEGIHNLQFRATYHGMNQDVIESVPVCVDSLGRIPPRT